ncbi:MAG: hypothetical protein ACXACC_02595 [Promethearchaeota archaeon]|jgi:hypothetical protein
MSPDFDKNLIQQVINSNEFKAWLISRRWFGDKLLLSNLEFRLVIKYFEFISDRIFITVITVEKENYTKSYFLPLIYYLKITDILDPIENTRENIVKLTENTFSKMLIRTIPEEGQSNVFLVNLIEAEYCLFFWKKLFFDKDISEFFPSMSLNLTLYTDQFQDEINMKQVQNLIEASLYPDRYELSLKQLGGGNTTNLLFLLSIKNLNTPDSRPISYVVKSYKEYLESFEPRILFVLVRNKFPSAPKIYGNLKFHEKETIGILENVPNIGNVGDIYWNELNNMISRVYKDLDEDYSYLDDTEKRVEIIKVYCSESLKVSEQIGVQIKNLHKAMILSDQIQFDKEIVDSVEYLRNYTNKLNSMTTTIESKMKKRSESSFFKSPKISSILIDIKDIIEKFRTEFQGPQIIIQPVHQDLHMQQILYNKTNGQYQFYFIDFEGDPQLTLEEKKNKFPIEKDLASFLRSLSYIKFNTLLHFIEEKIVDTKKYEVPEEFLFGLYFRKTSKITQTNKILEKIMKLLNSWENRLMGKLFDKSLNLHFTLINYFTIERTLHELDYELLFRPNKIIVPILGLKEIIDKY